MAFMVPEVLCRLLGKKGHQEPYLPVGFPCYAIDLTGRLCHRSNSGMTLMVVTNHFFAGVEAHSSGEISCLVCEPGGKTVAEGVCKP